MVAERFALVYGELLELGLVLGGFSCSYRNLGHVKNQAAELQGSV